MKTNIPFTKMQGLGNDFIVLDQTQKQWIPSPALCRQWADRHFGIGCDQLLILQPGFLPGVDFHFKIFNADGSEAKQCGNGARCLGKFIANRQGLAEGKWCLSTEGGVLDVWMRADGQVTAQLPQPLFAPAQIPAQFLQEVSGDYEWEIEGERVRFHLVNVGNPHAVCRIEAADFTPWLERAQKLAQASCFPEGVNVELVYVENKKRLNVLVCERGSGFTLACGSGATAAAVIAHQKGWVEAKVLVHQPGGDLHIDCLTNSGRIASTGPAEIVFEGVIQAACNAME